LWLTGVVLCALAQGCAAPGGNSAHEPLDAPVTAAGTAAGPSLTSAQKAELDATIASVPPQSRAQLRYAIAKDDAGKARLAVYDPGPRAPQQEHKKRTLVYVVYRMINAKDGSHYDPQEDAIVDPMPVPSERDLDASNAPRT